jgi:hypothetical protein
VQRSIPVSISHFEQVSVTCPICKHTFIHKIWLLIDASEKPELIPPLSEGILNKVLCPRCEQEIGWLDAPLLYFDASQEQLIFAPAQGTTQERDSEDLSHLMDRLYTALPQADTTLYLQRPKIIPSPLLPVYLKGGQAAVERELEEMWQSSLERFAPHVQVALQALREAGVETMEQMESFLTQRPELREGLEEAGIAISSLQEALYHFVQAETWNESREILQSHPELLEEAADREIAHLIELARHRADEETADLLQEHRGLLERCRSIGIKAAILEKVTELPAEEALQVMQTAVDEWLALESEEVVRLSEVVERNPLLRSAEALAFLQDRADEWRSAGRKEEAVRAEDRIELLRIIQQTTQEG